jgi:hypothetical protein
MLQFKLYVKGVFFGDVWLDRRELLDLFYIGQINGMRNYKSKTKQGAIYIAVTKGPL